MSLQVDLAKYSDPIDFFAKSTEWQKFVLQSFVVLYQEAAIYIKNDIDWRLEEVRQKLVLAHRVAPESLGDDFIVETVLKSVNFDPAIKDDFVDFILVDVLEDESPYL